MTTKKLNVLHAPTNVGNQPWGLSRGERLYGCNSQVVINYNTWLKYPSDICLGEYRKPTPVTLFRRLVYALSAPFRFDVLHYYFGRSLMCWDDYSGRHPLWFSDLKLAKMLGRKVFMTLQGCDVRIAHKSDAANLITFCRQGKCNAYQNCITRYDKQRYWLINNILPLLDQVFFLVPELGHFIPKGTFLPFANVDVENSNVFPPKLTGIPKILHAPSDTGIKGTDLILQALEQLQEKYTFEIILVKNKTHAEAMQLYQAADIAIDQVLGGWYAGFAVEMMAMGKPVMCYIRDEDLKFVPQPMLNDLPIRRVSPANLVEDIAAILEAREQWLAWSKASRQYVLKWHNPRIIAAAMVDAYRSADSNFDILKFVNMQNNEV